MSELIFTVEIKVKEDFCEVVPPFAQAMHKLTHEFDKGIIQYDLYTDKNDKSMFYFVEECEDEASLEAHNQKDHFKRFVEFLEGSTESIDKKFEKIDTSSLEKYEEMQ